jgi:predicted XRE-type DNA-binding protein
MEFYSAIKKNEIMLSAGKWIKMENFMLSEVSQAQKNQRPRVFSHI